MATTGRAPHSSSMPSRPTYSCIRCAERKVKCDRQKPCSTCVKHNVDCVFHPPLPPRKRLKGVKTQVLIDRLRHCEALLQKQGIDPSHLPDTLDSEPRSKPSLTVAVAPSELPMQTPSSISSIASTPNRSINMTRVVHRQARSKLIDNTLWKSVVEEIHDPEDALEDSSNEASEQEEEALDNDFGFVLLSQSKISPKPQHPPRKRILQLWQIFVENVNPLVKVVHVPTLRPAMENAASNTSTIPRSFEALMFAIYSMAVMSLKNNECRERLCESRKTLLLQYLSTTEAALSRANFMGTNSLIVLQALFVYILTVQYIYKPCEVWSLSGVAIRIAQRMGLDQDGIHLGLPIFETEMRRRIWWLLRSHDFRTAELCGLTKFRDMDTDAESTKWPSNINDDQLYPGVNSLPAKTVGLTDSSFVALRFEFNSLIVASVARFRQSGRSARQWENHLLSDDIAAISEGFSKLEERIETKYLRYCDPSQPLHLMLMLASRYAMNVVRFMTHHPRQWASIDQTPVAERERVWTISVNLLEQYNMVQSNPQIKQFAWYAAYLMHWHSFIHLLNTLRASPLMDDSEKVWRLIGTAYENNPAMILATKEPITAAVGNLCLKAYSAREAALQNRRVSLPPVPDFILKLRHQQEIVNARRQARDARISRLGNSTRYSQANVSDEGLRPDTGAIGSSYALESPPFHGGTVPHMPNLSQTDEATEHDPFWFVNRFDHSHLSSFNDVINMDVDSILAQDYDVEGNDAPNSTWDQWDAWLTDSRMMLPPSLS